MLWFIDNLGVVSSLCKGSSIVFDFGCVIHVLHMMAAARRLAVWWEHVDSKANISDGGTRHDLTGVQKLGVSIGVKPLPPWPDSLFSQPPAYWLGWLNG